MYTLLPGAGRPEHEQELYCRGGDDRTAGQFLTAHIGVVVIVSRERVEQLSQSGRRGIDVEVPGKKRNCLSQRGDGNHLQLLHDGGFRRIRAGHDDPAQYPLYRAADMAMDKAPLAGRVRYSNDNSPTTA